MLSGCLHAVRPSCFGSKTPVLLHAQWCFHTRTWSSNRLRACSPRRLLFQSAFYLIQHVLFLKGVYAKGSACCFPSLPPPRKTRALRAGPHARQTRLRPTPAEAQDPTRLRVATYPREWLRLVLGRSNTLNTETRSHLNIRNTTSQHLRRAPVHLSHHSLPSQRTTPRESEQHQQQARHHHRGNLLRTRCKCQRIIPKR